MQASHFMDEETEAQREGTARDHTLHWWQNLPPRPGPVHHSMQCLRDHGVEVQRAELGPARQVGATGGHALAYWEKEDLELPSSGQGCPGGVELLDSVDVQAETR